MWTDNGDDCLFFQYYYGTAIIFDAMYESTDLFSSNHSNYNTTITLDYNKYISQYLNLWLYNNTPNSIAYQITNGQILPWNNYSEHNIGDVTGLLPINYISQILYQYNNTKTPPKQIFNFSTSIWNATFITSDYYILQYPRRISDGTISRDDQGRWTAETDNNASFVWADDNYMGTALLARLASILPLASSINNVDVKNNMSTYINFVYEQNMLFSKHLLYPNSLYNGLYAHGYNAYSGDHSCCPWGRGEMWVILANVEAIKMYDVINDNKYNNDKKDIIKIYQNHINVIGYYQNKTNGRWHQIINDTSTFLETSASSGFLYAMIFGRVNNYLSFDVYNEKDWDDKIELGYGGLLSVIDKTNGNIIDQCAGTPIEPNVQCYNNRSREYCASGAPGDPGVVIHAINAYQTYLNFKQL
eukprot:246242_1